MAESPSHFTHNDHFSGSSPHGRMVKYFRAIGCKTDKKHGTEGQVVRGRVWC